MYIYDINGLKIDKLVLHYYLKITIITYATYINTDTTRITFYDPNNIIFSFFTVRQNQFDKLCNSERGWAFERVINGALDGYDHKRKDGVESRNECARLCLLESEFQCRSAEYNSDAKLCILSREDRRTQPEAFRYNVIGVDYIENQCAKRKKLQHLFPVKSISRKFS